jgi:hypothetical protein
MSFEYYLNTFYILKTENIDKQWEVRELTAPNDNRLHANAQSFNLGETITLPDVVYTRWYKVNLTAGIYRLRTSDAIAVLTKDNYNYCGGGGRCRFYRAIHAAHRQQ